MRETGFMPYNVTTCWDKMTFGHDSWEMGNRWSNRLEFMCRTSYMTILSSENWFKIIAKPVL